MNEKLLLAIQTHCKKSKTLHRCSSYGLKHLFEAIAGDYISNDEFKLAMSSMGYKPIIIDKSVNCRFYVSIVGNVPEQYLNSGYWYKKISKNDSRV